MPTLRSLLIVSAALTAACEEDVLVEIVQFEAPPPAEDVPCEVEPWELVPAPTSRGLSGIWGFGADDIWAVGGFGTLLHFDGTSWRDATPDWRIDDLLAVHGVSGDDLWVVGRNGFAAHYDGDEWTEVETGTDQILVDVWATGSDEVWMIGAEGARRWDGAAVRTQPGWPTGALNAIWASSRSDVRMVANEEAHRFDGTSFSTRPVENVARLTAIWGVDRSRVWTIGHDRSNKPGMAELSDGEWLFEAAPPRSFFFSLFTLDGGDLWAGADQSSIYFRAADSSWCRERTSGVGAITSFWGLPGGDLWAVGAAGGEGDTRPVLLRRR